MSQKQQLEKERPQRKRDATHLAVQFFSAFNTKLLKAQVPILYR